MGPGREKDLGVQKPKDGLTLAWTPGHRAVRMELPLPLAVGQGRPTAWSGPGLACRVGDCHQRRVMEEGTEASLALP